MTRHYTQGIVWSRLVGNVKGGTLRRIRKRLGLTQAALAKRLGVAPNTVARWERNELPIREPMALLIRLLEQTEGKGA